MPPTCSVRRSTPAGGRPTATTRRAPIGELRDRIFHVHLKDVERPGEHVTCLHGDGCVDIDGCVDALVEIGYDGAL